MNRPRRGGNYGGMDNLSLSPDALGWLAAGLMVATFACRDARCMRVLAVVSNLAFAGYGFVAMLPPVLALHLLLLPINLWRARELLVPRPAGERHRGA